MFVHRFMQFILFGTRQRKLCNNKRVKDVGFIDFNLFIYVWLHHIIWIGFYSDFIAVKVIFSVYSSSTFSPLMAASISMKCWQGISL